MRQKLLLLAAVFFGVLAFVLTYQQIQIERGKILGAAEDVVFISVKRDMVEGEKLKEADLMQHRLKRLKGTTVREIPWLQARMIIGRELAANVKRGQDLQWNDLKLASKGADGLTGIIPMGMRAISISVDATSSVTGLVLPGNHVDVIGTFRFPEMKGDKSLDTLTLTILQNVAVLATGTDYGKNTMLSQSQQRRGGYSNVTLALTPKEVEMIIFASQKGRLTLSLRNYEETKIEAQLQSVNFKYLEDNISKYNAEREKTLKKVYK